MTCPNTDGGAHGDRGHCVWQQMLCDSHQVISSTIFIIKIIIIWQQKQLAPKPTLSLSSLLWAVFTRIFFYISQYSPIRQSTIYPDFVLVLFHFPLRFDFDGYLPDVAGLNIATMLFENFAKKLLFTELWIPRQQGWVGLQVDINAAMTMMVIYDDDDDEHDYDGHDDDDHKVWWCRW